MTETFPNSPESIRRAAERLNSGGLVAFPTETVYGLGADATNDQAVAAIFAAKGRPAFNPLIIHGPDKNFLKHLVQWNEHAERLATRFWPGPLTMVLPRAEACPISLLAGAGLDTLAVRVPAHPMALDLLRAVGRPVAAPSANASGKLSPTIAAHVVQSLPNAPIMILDGGPCPVGVESTVLDLSLARPVILRPGGVTRAMIEDVIGGIDSAPQAQGSSAPHSPGMLDSHYAPTLPVRLNATEASFHEGYLTFGSDMTVKGGAVRLNLSPSGDPTEAAAHLFAYMRQLDRPGLTGIAVMPIPEDGLGAAINDRLRRAAAPRGYPLADRATNPG